jgi:peroxiredoxin
MALSPGDTLPAVDLQIVRSGKVERVSTADLFKGRKVVLFAVPGAFTPTCSAQHLPGFVEHAAAFKAKGIDEILCLSVNDSFVMDAWAKDRDVGDAVTMVADGSGDFTRAVGLEMDGSKFGMGLRSQRYALVADDGVVSLVAVEAPTKFERSSAEAILGQL